MSVTWEDPPSSTSRWGELLEPLAEQPGRWARVADHLTERQARDRVRDLRRSRYAGVDGDQWEFRCARMPEINRDEPRAAKWAVWARHIEQEQGT